MDNSPLWDAALERVAFDPELLPPYERVDVQVAEATERPSDGEYDRYVYLVTVFRELGYDSSRIKDVVRRSRSSPCSSTPFSSSRTAISPRSRASSAPTRSGSRPGPRARPRALDEQLWDEEHAVYVDFDVKAGKRVEHANRRRARAALRRGAESSRAPSAWSSCWRARGSRSATPAGP